MNIFNANSQDAFLFVLGAIDPEMLTISRELDAAGVQWTWAHTADAPDAGSTPIRVPADAYRVCDTRIEYDRPRVVVWVECRPAGMTRDALFERGDEVIDHHDPRKVYQDSYEESSVAQVLTIARCYACGQDGGHRWPEETAALGRLMDRMTAPNAHRTGHALRADLRVAGAVDHCLGAALSGRVEGVDSDDALRACAMMACDRDLARLKGTRPEADSPEEYLGQIEAAQAILRGASKITLGGVEVCDLLSHEGKIPALPVAAAHARLAYVIETPARPGVPATCALGGATTPRCVQVFAELARDAFTSELPFAPALAEHRNAGGARDGVYEFPERGFAGVYLPAEVFRESLRCEALRLLAELIRGGGAFGDCLMLAAEHATAGAGAVREMTDVRRAVRDAMRRAYEMGVTHG